MEYTNLRMYSPSHDASSHDRPLPSLAGQEFSTSSLFKSLRFESSISRQQMYVFVVLFFLLFTFFVSTCSRFSRKALSCVFLWRGSGGLGAAAMAIAAGILAVAKEDGETNLADLLTKILTGSRRWDLCWCIFQ